MKYFNFSIHLSVESKLSLQEIETLVREHINGMCFELDKSDPAIGFINYNYAVKEIE